MDTATFSPSIDWSVEPVHSAVWVLAVFLVTVAVLVVVAAVIGRTTAWGRQFVRITGRYFTGRQSLPAWGLLAVLLLLTIVSVRISILLTYYARDLFTALQVAFQTGSGAGAGATGVQGFWSTMLVFAVLAVCYVIRLLADLYVTQRFIMRWRIWLSRRFIHRWLNGNAYFRMQFGRQPVDNPDQRIQADIDIFTTGAGAEPNNPAYTSSHVLVFGAVEAVLSALFFGIILWELSGPLSWLGVTVPRALFWIVLAYVLAATVVAFVIGRPMIRYSYVNELRNASFRYALVRMRDAGAAVGMYRGEHVERRLLDGRLSAVMDNYRHWLNRMMLFIGWNTSASQAINPLPYIVQAQRLFAQQITFGEVIQSAQAFGAIHDSLSFFRNAYDNFASYRAATIRLDGLARENRIAAAGGRVEVAATGDGTLAVDEVEVRTPEGTALIRDLSLQLAPGDSLVISGPSGIGKTVLLQSLAGMWPFASGTVELPGGRDGAMFLPQLPYLPLGDLRAVASYPTDVADDREIQSALLRVALSHLVIRLNEVRDWSKVLSPGEQQRVAFARVLLTRPRVVFLDESTAAMDEGLELMLYDLLRAELPEAILVSVSHRTTVAQMHRRRLQLVGDGRWHLGPATPG
ncbi:ABC transporter ATP-binding protein/permease [Mycolicibacterium arseniciresistens]|uniref:ABC transporter ATP-binding protein/permease n=1 Tax=Mycolicibacterium arseniciresistens TaxID=3062257 RepID=A0ABT8URB1_9MYCO|nr:ABC transporter ATP-binding protein/permease [Mycolicibacterium arseniciresistens]MDO3639522.1 ABC transporter ATP-binding protein/permease [Mycolicibacterium arseniciresistens]